MLKNEVLKYHRNYCYLRNNSVTNFSKFSQSMCPGVKYKILLLISAILLSHTAMMGQFVINGGTPASTRWMQVKGDRYKVIYPQGADSLAKRYLWLLEQNSSAVMLGLGGIKPAGIPVVLYNGTANSNGMVVWAPKRMELFTLPMRPSYPVRWEEQLAVHESRHVGQMTHFTKGIYKLGTVLIGQQAPSLGVGIYPSRWMLEGDAVVAETELTNSGRGRNAEFMEYYRAAFLEGDIRRWERWKQGSYKYYTPNLYAMGYLINSTIRYSTGKYAYAGEVFDGFVKKFYTPFARDVSYEKSVGKGPRLFFRQGREMMTGIWQEELAARGTITEPQEQLLERGKEYQEYFSPVSVGKDSVLYIKYSYNNAALLVLVSGGKEEVIRGFSASASGFRCHGDHIYFTENISSSRWSNYAFGTLFRFNWRAALEESGTAGERGMKRLSGRKYYKSPDLSVAGDTVMVVEFFPQGGSALALLDARSGEVVQKIGAPDGGQITESVFLGNYIYALAVTGRGLGLFRMPEGQGEWESVVGEQAASIEDLHCAVVEDETGGRARVLYFVSDIDGVRNIYMFNPVEGELRRLTNSRYGATAPHIAEGNLYYSSLELGGRFPVRIALADVRESNSAFEPRMEGNSLVGNYRYRVADELSAQAREALAEKGLLAPQEEMLRRNGTSIVNYSVSEEEYAESVEAQRYSRLGNLFRFHSWAPVYYNVDRIMEFDFDKIYEVASLGATAYSQNTLGTAVTMLGYSYHKGLHAGHFKFKYTGWYPAFQIGADVNAAERYNVRVVRDSSGVKRVVQEASGALVELDALAYLPMSFNSHGWQRGLVPQVRVEYDNNGYYDTAKGKYLNGGTITPALQFYVMRDMAHSGIFPKYGFGGVARWRFSFNGGENFGDVSSLYLYGYLPGLAPNHGVKLSMSTQHHNADGKNYYLGNLVDMPRGYDEDFYSENYFMGTFDYAFPIYLGDTHVWRLAYLKRMQVIPFADYAVGKFAAGRNGKAGNSALYSCGTSVLVDFAPFSIGLECSIGVRYSYNGNNGGLPGKGSAVHFLFSTSLY